MKLFTYTSGLDVKYGVATDAEDAYNRRSEVDPTFEFAGATIEEVVVAGHIITVEAEGKKAKK